MKKILYLSLTGMTEPLGRSQVLGYLVRLSRSNKIYLISFERTRKVSNIDDIVSQNNIIWKHYPYSNKYGILSSIGQILIGVVAGSRIITDNSIEIIHARSMIPAIVGLILKKIYKKKLIFDIRGFAVDEKVDSGHLRKDTFFFKILKYIDDYLYKSSDHVITLTHKAKDILIRKNIKLENITVIPTCASREIFKIISKTEKDRLRSSLGYNHNDIIIVHTGTVSGWYDFDSELQLMKEIMLLNGNVKFLILNQYEHTFIRNLVSKYNLNNKNIKVLSIPFDKMFQYLNVADFSIFFIKTSYSKLASMPTKFAENIACHLPSITNYGVGDMDLYMENYNVGYLVNLEELTNNLLDNAYDIVDYFEKIIVHADDYNSLFYKYFDSNIANSKYQLIYDQVHNGM